MTDALIIPFPAPRATSADPDRLSKALAGLQAALEEQRAALSDWRFAMAELGVGVAGLGHALAGYQDSLAVVEDRLTGLHAHSSQLESWADGVLKANDELSPPGFG
jgi:hypothetical protein